MPKRKVNPKPAGRKPTNIIEPLNATPEQVARAILYGNGIKPKPKTE